MNPKLANPAFPVLLALATSTERCSVALNISSRETSQRILCLEAEAGQQSSGSILQLIERLLSEAALGKESIDVIAFDQGPGAFTGVRLGCSVAQGLGYALNRPLLALSSLEVIAAAALAGLASSSQEQVVAPRARRLVCSAIDARMQEIYFAAYVADGESELRLYQAAVVNNSLTVGRLIEAISAKWHLDESGRDSAFSGATRPVGAGNAFVRFPELSDCAQHLGMSIQADVWPGAVHLANVAARHWSESRMIAAQQAEPLYIRNKVALNVEEQRQK